MGGGQLPMLWTKQEQDHFSHAQTRVYSTSPSKGQVGSGLSRHAQARQG